MYVRNGMRFIMLPIDFNNKLVQFFQKEKANKLIYEAQGGFGQKTPSQTPLPSSYKSMTESSDILRDPSDIETTSEANQEDDDIILSTSSSRQ